MLHLTPVLADRFGLRGPFVTREARGHSNETFAVRAGGERLFARRSAGPRPAAEIAREEALLDRARRGGLPVARVLPTLAGPAHHRDEDGRVVHLFSALPGEPASYRGPQPPARVRSALGLLARLHRALAGEPGGERADILGPLALRLQRLRGRSIVWTEHPLASEIEPRVPHLLARVEELRAETAARAPAATQWVHGDFHPGNVLFAGDEAAGVVDFDDATPAAPELELGLALFAFARHERDDERFRFDPELVEVGHAAYRAAGGAAGPLDRAALALDERLFCAHQALVHLDAAARGLWRLERGIGLLACFDRVLDP